LGVGFAGAVVGMVAAAWQEVLRWDVERAAVGRVVGAAAGAELAEFEDPRFHDRVERAVAAATAHAPMLLTVVLSGLRAVLMLVAVAVGLVVMAWWLLPLLLVAAGPPTVVAVSRQRAQYALARELSQNHRERRYLMSLLTGREEAKEVRAFGLTGLLSGRLDALYQDLAGRRGALQRRFLVRGAWARLVGDAVVACGVAVVLASVKAGWLSTATALTALGGMYLGARQVTGASGMVSATGASLLYLADLRDFTSKTEPALSVPSVPPPPGPLAGGGGEGTAFTMLEARDVSFTYPSGRQPALREVSVCLRAGEITALVGENGSGKTTLAKLLAGLYRPGTGRILLDGAPAGQDRLRELSAVMFQDYLRYRLTAAENIALSRPDHLTDRDRTEAAARLAGIDAVLRALPEGYDTRMGTEFARGAELSLGQWQRIALARAFFRDAPLVVLDEPTAAIDPQAEAALFTRLRTLFTGRTVLLITHRLAAAATADHIYVLDHGRITEHGTHRQLIQNNGLYTRMFHAQAATYAQRQTENPTNNIGIED
ncbi:ABC transporter ATP-binding protein, partial [Streptomyces sp. NPDC054849]